MKEPLTIRLSSALDTILAREPIATLGLEPPELKADVHHPTQTHSYWPHAWSSTRINYEEVRDNLTGSSVVMAAVNWLATTMPEAPFQVTRVDKQGTAAVDTGHKLTRLMRRPNKFHAGSLLMKAFALSWLVDGNVYWMKVRSQRNEVVELWYIPHFMIEPYAPQGNDTVFIESYKYKVNGKDYYIPVEDVIQFKNGVDPENPRKGLSPLAAGLREVYTGNEVANFSATLLRNMGVVSHLLAPKESGGIDTTEAQAIKAVFEQNTTGENKGRALVNTIPMDVTKLGFSPAEMDLSKLRHLSEVAVSSLTGIPSAVLQYMIGQENGTSYASYEQARQQGTESVVIPTWKCIGEEMDAQILPDFEQNIDGVFCGFDLTQVRVLQEDEDAKHTRVQGDFRARIVDWAEARTALNYPAEKEHEGIMYSPMAAAPAKPEPAKEGVEEEAPAKSYVSSNGYQPTSDEVERMCVELEREMKEFVGVMPKGNGRGRKG